MQGNPIIKTALLAKEAVQTNGTQTSSIVDPNDPTRKGEFDGLFKVPLTINTTHHEVHEGDMFCGIVWDEDAATGHVIQGYIKTPAIVTPQKRIHLVINYESTGASQFILTKDVTYSSGGALFTPQNRNLGSAKVSAIQAGRIGSSKNSNPIVYTGGTVIWNPWEGSGRTLSGGDRGTEEWVLAPGKEYIFELVAKAPGIGLVMSALWYEHTDG